MGSELHIYVDEAERRNDCMSMDIAMLQRRFEADEYRCSNRVQRGKGQW